LQLFGKGKKNIKNRSKNQNRKCSKTVLDTDKFEKPILESKPKPQNLENRSQKPKPQPLKFEMVSIPASMRIISGHTYTLIRLSTYYILYFLHLKYHS